MSKGKQIVVFVFVISVIIILFFGYLYLKGFKFGSDLTEVEVYFQEVSGLKTGSAVFIRGIEKGRVKSVELASDNLVRVKVLIDNKIKIAEDSKFSIKSLSYFGTDRILAITPGQGPIASKEYRFYGDNEVIDLERIFTKLDRLVSQFESETLKNELRSFKAELYQQLNYLLKDFSSPLLQVSKQLEAIVMKLDSFSAILQKEGSIQKMMSDKELYEEIRTTNHKLSELLDDIKNNPKKYFTIKLF